MADVTISSLPLGAPAGNNILPYSTGSNTLAVPVSALFQGIGSNIGIGTPIPSAILHIKDTSPHLRIDSSTSSWAYTSFNTLNNYSRIGNEGITGGELMGGALPYSAIFGSMNGTTHIGAGGSVLLTCTNTSKVGIGTTTPAAKLEVVGDVKATNTPKAWVNFDGTGAIGTNQTIRSSYNVASVYKGNTGSYRITFTSAQTDNNYCVTGASAPAYSAYWTNLALHTAAPTNGGTESAPTNAYFDVCVVMQTAGKVDSKYVSVVVL
jgi:hypothetical protein